MSFSDLGLGPDLLRAIEEVGYTEPTPIQSQAIPHVLMGRDVLGIAQTGTGKTASFTLPMIEILDGSRAKARMPRSLILAPTRELATQVSDNFAKYGKHHRLSFALLIGGESMGEQQRNLERGVDVLIATPGRLIDLFDRGSILLTDVKVLVIDEADRMLDMGFIPDVERIVKMLPKIRQTLFFSATMDDQIRKLADAFLMNPREVRVAPKVRTAETVEQKMVVVSRYDKREALRTILRDQDVANAFIFCNRKRDVDILTRSLIKHGFDATSLHGDMAQYVRTERLEKFKNGETRLLVCSDVAARGIDITDVSHVFNFDVPTHAEDYVHRIGRTGRAGKTGHSFTIAEPADQKYVDAITSLIGHGIDLISLDGFAHPALGEETDDDNRRGRRGSGGRGRDGRGRDGRGRGRNRNSGTSDGVETGSSGGSDVAAVQDDQPDMALLHGGGPENQSDSGSYSNRDRSSGGRNGRGGSGRYRAGQNNDDRRGGRPGRGRRGRDDAQSEVMTLDIPDDVVGFGGYTPAFMLVEPMDSLRASLAEDMDGTEAEAEGTLESRGAASDSAPASGKDTKDGAKPKRRTRRRRNAGAEDGSGDTDAPPRRRRSRKSKSAASEDSTTPASADPVFPPVVLMSTADAPHCQDPRTIQHVDEDAAQGEPDAVVLVPAVPFGPAAIEPVASPQEDASNTQPQADPASPTPVEAETALEDKAETVAEASTDGTVTPEPASEGERVVGETDSEETPPEPEGISA